MRSCAEEIQLLEALHTVLNSDTVRAYMSDTVSDCLSAARDDALDYLYARGQFKQWERLHSLHSE